MRRRERCTSGKFLNATTLLTLASVGAAAAAPEYVQRPTRSGEPVLVKQGPIETAVLRGGARGIQVETETEVRFMCGSDTSHATIDDLRAIALAADAGLAAAGNGMQARRGGSPSGGLDIVFVPTGTIPAEAQPALDAVEAYLESIFGDPITVNIGMRFAQLGPGILGSTGSNYIFVNVWDDVRNGLIADMDIDDTIQLSLPAGTIPVRYNASGTSVTNETGCWMNRSSFDAAVGFVGGTAANMTFNTDFAWAYDPADLDFTKIDFQSVLVHEVGHALGFTSRADISFNSDIRTLDIYRFQRSDPAWNPSTLTEFTTTPRTVDSSFLTDDSNSDIIIREHRMANAGPGGPPPQGSHFRATNPGINIMDPSLAFGETFFPDFLRTGDLDMFDAIGWDYPFAKTPTGPSSPHDVRKNRWISFVPNNQFGDVALQVELVSGPGATGVLGWVSEPWDPSCQNEDGSPLPGSPPCWGNEYLARVVNTRVDRSWSEPVIHVGDCEIVPVADYNIRAILAGADEANPANFSAPFAVSTIPKPNVWWGDAVEVALGGGVWLPPQGVVNIADIQAAQLTQQGQNGPPETWVDLDGIGIGNPPNFVINVADIQQFLFAQQGKTYLESSPDHRDPADCP